MRRETGEQPLRILVLSPVEPYPPNGGWALVVYNDIIHLLGRGHELHLLVISHNPRAQIEPMQNICSTDYFRSYKPPRWVQTLLNLGKTLPFGASRYFDKRLLARASQLLKARKFDVILVEDVSMAMYGPLLRAEFKVPYFVRGHNVGSKVHERFIAAQRNPIVKMLAKWQGCKYERYERSILGASDGCSMITEVDALEIKQLFPELEPSVVSAGTDLEYFQAGKKPRDPNLLVHVGSLTAHTKLPAMLWFCEKVLPLVRRQRPDVRLELVGLGPAKAFEHFEGVHFLGRVPDVRPHLTGGRVFVAPQFVGSGVRLKIINAMATGNAIVATPVACEGIGLQDGKQALIRADEDSFAEGVLSILQNDALALELGTNARSMVEENYGWPRIIDELEKRLRQAAAITHG